MKDPVVMGGAGGLELNGAGEAALVKPLQGPFVLLRRNLLFRQFPGPPRVNEEKDVMGGGADLQG